MAAPSYLKKHGTPRSPAALAEHACVLFPSKPEGLSWELHHGRRRVRVRVRGSLSANNLESVYELALRGQGIAMLPESYATTGGLQRILEPWASEPIPVHAVYLDRKFVPAKLQALLSELLSWKTNLWRAER
jgi:DNA-binding transcriptional LysR family regulator